MACLAAVACVTGVAAAAGPVLHTFFEPQPEEDLALRATTAGGKMPAALDTPSGTVRAPDVGKEPDQSEVAYGGTSTPSSVDASYRIDKDTSRPDLVQYDDPFIPAVTPFKRLYAYDSVDSAFELVVHDKRLERITVGGNVASGDDQFYGDLVVDLAEDTAVRIPSVGPRARILAASTKPEVKFEILRDGADNWFVRAPTRKRVRLVLQLAISRATFGSDFANVGWSALARHVPLLPPSATPAASEVLAKLGVSKALSPRQALSLLVQHFRSFSPSTARPGTTGIELYKELALEQKGVCRHRAYAFVITALALGLPSRMARNEAHAWVEVYDGSLWHRVDLGGAAGEMQTDFDPSQPVHQPPEDPFAWPEGSESGSDMANRALGSSGSSNGSGSGSSGGGSGAAGPNAPTPAASGALQPGADGGLSAAPGAIGPDGGGVAPEDEPDDRPEARVAVAVSTRESRRGEPIPVSGRIEADGTGCGGVRVDFALRSENGQTIPIQSIAAGPDGSYSGSVVVPPSVDVGDYELVVSTPGDQRCGRGSAE